MAALVTHDVGIQRTIARLALPARPVSPFGTMYVVWCAQCGEVAIERAWRRARAAQRAHARRGGTMPANGEA